VQGAGNCRLGQYPVFLDQMIDELKLENVCQMVLMNEDGFAGLGNDWSLRAVQALIISDVLEDIRAGIMANAVDSQCGMELFENEFSKLETEFALHPKEIYKLLEKFAVAVKENVPAKNINANIKQIAMIGEIFCRKDVFAHK
jgi:predicted nucleotide-binding protein (sugar kinase/HSP70/actin superfamily)